MDVTRRRLMQASGAAAALLPLTVQAFASNTDTAAKPVTGLIGTAFVTDTQERGSFPLAHAGAAAPIWHDATDHKAVLRAIADLQADTARVTGLVPVASPVRTTDTRVVIIGTVGHSAPIDQLIKAGKLSAADLTGKWESFVITTLSDPMPGIDQALVIAGSDRRGTIFGIYEVCEQLGVSPWYWWADVPPKKRGQAYVRPGRYASGEPVVRYRGIFINDEAPCMTKWTNETFGGFNSKMYAHMFELILRLRGNYLWPAMWNSAFNEDDPATRPLADDYGIVVGTSHHEPMTRNQKEWTKSHARYGNGEWNYNTNAAGLNAFWRDGVRRNAAYESLVTMGMRGDGDLAKPSAGSLQADVQQLETIISDQRRILADELKTDASKVPQLWALFTEVQALYDAGMKVPDDVTLLFTDDNVGNLRRLPTPAERKRSGGAGIYYHFDMHGGPYAYQWINTNPFPKIWEQMTLANAYGANRIWIVNVGDLKPLELPIEFFIRMAWNPRAISRDQIGDYTRRWAARDFGEAHADEVADLVSLFTKYNGWRKPEVVRPETYSLINYREAELVETAWDDVTRRAEALYARLPSEHRDAFYELVLHPAKASGIVTRLNIAAGRSQLYALQGRASANIEAARARELFRQDQDMSDYYNHQLAGGRWNHLMDQTHIGEFDWQPPHANVLPPVSELLVKDTDNFGVAIEGDVSAWPDHYGDAVLPAFDSLNPRRSYFEVFAAGQRKPDFVVTPDADWVRVSEDKSPRTDRRFWVDIDWAKAPQGSAKAVITVSGNALDVNDAPTRVLIHVNAVKASPAIVSQARGRFASLGGPIAIAAAQPTKRVAVGGASWEMLPDYGRGAAAMTIMPVTAPSVLPPQPAPQLQYAVWLPEAGTYHVTMIVGPVMDHMPDRGIRVGASFDDAPTQVIDLFDDRKAQTFLGAGWIKAAKDNARFATSSHAGLSAGPHTFKVTMVDPAIVLQKLIISQGDLPDSYFGPPDTAKAT